MTPSGDASVDNALNLDRILTEEVGSCGRYQIRAISLLAVIAVLQSLAKNEYIFTFTKVQTRCLIPACENSSSYLNFTPPWILNAVPPSQNSFDNCQRYANTTANMTESCPAENFDRDSLIACEEYVFEDKNSAIYDFSMACDVWRPNVLGSIDLFGMMISLPITGFVADRWGRRVAITISSINHALFGCLKFFASSYISYLLLSLLQAVTGACATTCAYILALEYVGPEYRVLAGSAMSTFVAFGTILKGLIAWTGPSWRHLILIVNAPLFIGIFYLWLVPESFRWLISKGHYKEAEKVVKKAANINGIVLSEKTLHTLSNNDKQIKNDGPEAWIVSLVFKHKKILFRCILTPTWWITTLFIHFGLIMSSVGVTGNKYLNFSAVAAASIPGYLAAALLLNRIGRKPLLIAGYWICGSCQIAYVLIPEGHYWLSLSVYLFGKLTISAVMTTIYVYTSELYPTRYRSRLLGYSSMIGRLGGLLGPLTPALSDAIWKPLPFVLFAVMAFLCGALVTLAPETLGCALPESMQDAENLGRDSHGKTMVQRLRRLVFRRKCYTVR